MRVKLKRAEICSRVSEEESQKAVVQYEVSAYKRYCGETGKAIEIIDARPDM